ncbi:hypothetical protein [Rahnella sp. ChDrAdgB13]|uniref:hypothetical protein n=1 Tax=Rahnella sp. ChDrAdgB13 TaxID=1850581 RepID=UPI001AD85918|nr:hypothetical protein [Rahnella sp. ChDrAdgB13]
MRDKMLIQLSGFSRESQLKKKWAKDAKAITPLQQTWTRYMLMNWGAKHRGGDGPDRGAINILGRLMWRDHWNSDEGKHIQVIFSNLGKQGYSGEDLIRKVKEIFAPGNSGFNAISLAKEQDDAEFVEKCMVETFTPDSPLRDVLIKRYRDRKSAQVIAGIMESDAFVHIEVARIRVRWAENLAEQCIYHCMKAAMEKENLLIAE